MDKLRTEFKKSKKEILFSALFFIIIAILIFIPTGFEKNIYVNAEGVRAKIIAVDNTSIYNTGMINQGEQTATIKILSGNHKGKEIQGTNMLTGKLELDKFFEPGDTAWVLIEQDSSGKIIFANLIDHYRIGNEILLVSTFTVLLIIFSGFTGVRTLLSFLFALLSIWKILIPLMLKGYSPILVSLFVGNALTITTLLLVGGFTKKSYAAIISSISCSFITAITALAFGHIFEINGAVMQWSESLIYAGFKNLDLTGILYGGIYLASSGAILDLAIDISSALEEIQINHPKVSRKSLFDSGIRIGKSVVGSQTTTLLLAYMGSYISVMMVYMAQGTNIITIFNSKPIAAEVLHTFVGCIGLVLVSPLTSLVSSIYFTQVDKTDDIKISA